MSASEARLCRCGRYRVPAGRWFWVEYRGGTTFRHRPEPFLCDYQCATCGSIDPKQHWREDCDLERAW